QVDLQDSLVAYYPLDNNGLDESVNDNHALEVNEPLPTEGVWGEENTAYFFDGLDDYIEIPNNPNISVNNSDSFAISLWLNLPPNQVDQDGQVNDILSKWSAITSDGYGYTLRIFNQNSIESGKLWFGRFDTNGSGCSGLLGLFSIRTINDLEWHHVVIQRRSNGQIEMYLDGRLEGTIQDNAICSVENDQNLFLGMRTLDNLPSGGRRNLTGTIDELRVYDRPLSQADIDQLFDPVVTNVQNLSSLAAIKVYPNPISTNQNITLEIPPGKTLQRAMLYDVRGRMVQRSTETDLRVDLPSGVYWLRAILDNEQVGVTRLLIE
ncbi:MAG: LamG-like jellyroll fold domain-containing protein, partial [Bacteroidota bacterium]